MGQYSEVMQHTVRQNIQWIRMEKGLSQKEFAELIGVHQSLVSGWERGARKLTPQSLKLVALALGLPISYFLVNQIPNDVEVGLVNTPTPKPTPFVQGPMVFNDLTELFAPNIRLIWKNRVLTDKEKKTLERIIDALLQ